MKEGKNNEFLIKVDMEHPLIKDVYKTGAIISKKALEDGTNIEGLLTFMLGQIKHDLLTKIKTINKVKK